MAQISIRFSIKAGGDLLFLGLFESPEALRQIQMLRDNGAYAVVASPVGFDCEECEDKGITNDGINDHYCYCNLGEIMHKVNADRVKNQRLGEEVRAMQLQAEVNRQLRAAEERARILAMEERIIAMEAHKLELEREQAYLMFQSDSAIVSVKFDSGQEVFRSWYSI